MTFYLVIFSCIICHSSLSGLTIDSLRLLWHIKKEEGKQKTVQMGSAQWGPGEKKPAEAKEKKLWGKQGRMKTKTPNTSYFKPSAEISNCFP